MQDLRYKHEYLDDLSFAKSSQKWPFFKKLRPSKHILAILPIWGQKCMSYCLRAVAI